MISINAENVLEVIREFRLEISILIHIFQRIHDSYLVLLPIMKNTSHNKRKVLPSDMIYDLYNSIIPLNIFGYFDIF